MTKRMIAYYKSINRHQQNEFKVKETMKAKECDNVYNPEFFEIRNGKITNERFKLV